MIDIGSDTQLFLDDYAVEASEGLTRTVHHPVRLPEPVVGGNEPPLNFIWTACFSTALYDEEVGRFRMWLDVGFHVMHTQSSDGIHWEPPQSLWYFKRDGRSGFGASVIDDRKHARDPRRSFKLANYQTFQENSEIAGTHIAWSPDGFEWIPYEGNPALSAHPEGRDKSVPYAARDHTDLFYDAIRERYCIPVGLNVTPEDEFDPRICRLVGMSVSKDFIHWERPWRIFVPDAHDEPGLEFYGMGSVQRRGSLLVGLVRILRDDLKADDPPDPPEAFGVGYTVLACSRNGEKWHRYREPFLDRHPQKGSFDHAHAWAFSAVPVGQEVFIYYAGYDRGHKTGKRQVGLARIRKDGYVSLDAGMSGGSLVTPPLVYKGGRLALNVDAGTGGEVRVEMQDAEGSPIPGFALAQSDGITGSDVDQGATWGGSADISALEGKPVRLKIALRGASLYALQFAG